MLCLFWLGYAFFAFFILGIGKPFKIKGLRLIWVCCALNSQKFEKAGWAGWVCKMQAGRKMQAGEKCSWKMQLKNASETTEGKWEIGNCSLIILLLLYYYIYSYTYHHVHFFTTAYNPSLILCISLHRQKCWKMAV